MKIRVLTDALIRSVACTCIQVANYLVSSCQGQSADRQRSIFYQGQTISNCADTKIQSRCCQYIANYMMMLSISKENGIISNFLTYRIWNRERSLK